jgi:hypothetical protein
LGRPPPLAQVRPSVDGMLSDTAPTKWPKLPLAPCCTSSRHSPMLIIHVDPACSGIDPYASTAHTGPGLSSPAPMTTVVLAATHSTAPWYFILIPLALVAARLLFWRRRGGRGGGPFGRGPFGDGGGNQSGF